MACSHITGTSAVAVIVEPNCFVNIMMISPFACAGPGTPSNQPLPPTQVPAMADMQAQWGKQLGWTGNASTAACSWPGVHCNQAGIYGIVISIDVSASDLSGAIPASISALTTMVSFNCSQNPLIGGQIPADLGSISSLRYLDMSYSGLTGTLPSNLQSLKLSTLAVTSNKLTGPVQATICSIKNYNLQGNMWDCPLPTCCGESGSYLCVPCVSNSSSQ
ncbi:MAG: hypothetical protein Q8P67_15955 [archaeon]|nr:hypothetical protein [archaeon]